MGELKRVRSSLDGMCNQVHSLLNEQQRAKDKAQAEVMPRRLLIPHLTI